MPSAVDAVFVFMFVVVGPLVEHFYFWPAFRGDVASGRKNPRVRGYQRGMVGQCLFALAALAICVGAHRAFSVLLLAPQRGWRLLLSIAVVAAVLPLVLVHI